MTLFEILPSFIYGKKIHRLSWNDKLWFETSDGEIIKTYMLEENGNKCLLHLGEKFSLDDVTADDWELFKN